MSSFSFNFLPEGSNSNTEGQGNAQEISNHAPSKPSSKRSFQWVPNLPELIADRSQVEIIYDDIPLEVIDDTLRRVDMEMSSFVDPCDTDNVSESWRTEVDIEPGAYEGGLKVWECSLDLVHYIAEHDIALDQGAILELGCGHGLPACLMLRQGLRKRKQIQNNQDFFVYFTDYNKFVLKDVTLSNIVLNTADIVNIDEISHCVRLGGGDWVDFCHQWRNEESDEYFDIILAAETIYSEASTHEMAQILDAVLRPVTGVAWIASKRYYFGVGGGVDMFRRVACNEYSLEVTTERVYDNGSGNIRELLKVTKKLT